MPRQKRNTGNPKNFKIGNAVKSIDLFGEGLGFTIGGSSTHKSYLGAFLTLCIIVVTLSYAIDRAQTMMAFGDTVHQGTTSESDFSREQPLILSESGVSFAIAITDSTTFIPVSASEMEGYGTISFMVIQWDADSRTLDRKPLLTHACTDEDIELYYPQAEPGIMAYLKDAVCMDDLAEIQLYGTSAASAQSSFLNI